MAVRIDNIPKTNRMIVTYIYIHIHIICNYKHRVLLCSLEKPNRSGEKERIIYSWAENNLNSVCHLVIISPEFYTEQRGKNINET